MHRPPLQALLLVAILAAASACADGPRQSRESVVEEITRLTTVEWPQAIERGDVQWFERRFADELLMINGQTGEVTTKAQELASIGTTEAADDSTNKFEDFRVNLYDDVAVAAFRIDISGTDHRGPWFRTARSTEVWVFRDGRWQIVALHSNPLPGHVHDHEPFFGAVEELAPESSPPPN